MPAKKLGFIQALRGLAILLVLGNHFPGRSELGQTGYVGVDLFFVISGFIMVVTTTGNDGSFRYFVEFCIKRFARVWPAYAVATIIVLVICHRSSWSIRDPESVKWLIGSLTFYPLWINQPIDRPGWSLCFEMWFYLVFAISLLGGRFRWVVYFGSVLVLMVLIPSLFLKGPNLFVQVSTFGADSHLHSLLSMFIDPINWAFPLGVIAGLIYRSPLVIRGAAATNAAFIAIFIPITFLYFDHDIHGLIWALPFAVMICLLSLHDKWSSIPVPLFLTFVGDISYSIYVIHWPIAWLCEQNLYPIYASDRTWVVFIFFGFVIASIAVAYPFHIFIERKLSDRIKVYCSSAVIALLRTLHVPPVTACNPRSIHTAVDTVRPVTYPCIVKGTLCPADVAVKDIAVPVAVPTAAAAFAGAVPVPK